MPKATARRASDISDGAEGSNAVPAEPPWRCAQPPETPAHVIELFDNATQEQAAWSSRLAPLVTNLQGVLQIVGAQRFCQMIDRVANPYDWSLASEVAAGLARGSTLHVVQDAEIAAPIEASAIATDSFGVLVVVAPLGNSAGISWPRDASRLAG